MTYHMTDLMYEFRAKDIEHSEGYRRQADQVAKEIKEAAGWDVDIHFNIEPEAKRKGLFTVAISVTGLGEPVVVKKAGKHITALMKKVKRATLKQIHRLNKREVYYRHRRGFREPLVS